MTSMLPPDHVLALPCWKGAVTVEPLKGGLSNESWVVTDAAGQHVARFGRDFPFHHVERLREVATARAAHAAGFGPAVEYAGFGTAMFDLAGAASNAGMEANETEALLQAYLGYSPDEDFRRAFDAMQAASLLREAMWAMVSDLHLSAPGADYRSYAAENLEKLAAKLSDFTRTHGTL